MTYQEEAIYYFEQQMREIDKFILDDTITVRDEIFRDEIQQLIRKYLGFTEDANLMYNKFAGHCFKPNGTETLDGQKIRGRQWIEKCISLVKQKGVLSPENAKIKKTPTNEPELTHRQHAIIYRYKALANYIPNEFRRTVITAQYGKGREKAIDTIWNEKGANYRPVTGPELNSIIPFLAEFPNALKAAINDLDRIENNR